MSERDRRMGDELAPDEPGFLSRWSRRKAEARETERVEPQPVAREHEPEPAPPQLPPLETLTPASDFKPFLHPSVDENIRRAALKTLFSDPHFNVMDGLDVYIDDYSKSDPIPAAMLASLKQAQRILTWAEGKDEEASAAEAESTEAISRELAPPEPRTDTDESAAEVTSQADRVAHPK